MNKKILKVCLITGVMTLSSLPVSAGGIDFMASPAKINRASRDMADFEDSFFELVRKRNQDHLKVILEKDAEISEKDAEISEKDAEISEKDEMILQLGSDRAYLRVRNSISSVLQSEFEQWKEDTSKSLSSSKVKADVAVLVQNAFSKVCDMKFAEIDGMIDDAKESIKNAATSENSSEEFQRILGELREQLKKSLEEYSLDEEIKRVSVKFSALLSSAEADLEDLEG